MKRIESIKTLCLKYMKTDTLCNIDDFYLYSVIAEHITKRNGNYDTEVETALKVLKNHYKYNMPSYTTVLRSRVALHRQYPTLRVCGIAEKRKKQEELYHRLFKG